MSRATCTIAVVAFLCIAAANSLPGTFESPCECHDNHGQHRWSVKIHPSLPPTDANAIQAVTSAMWHDWPGIDAQLTWQSERTRIETKWFALTGRVVAVKVEADGDLHIALQDATGDKPGIGVCDVPCQATWCEIHETVFQLDPDAIPSTHSTYAITHGQRIGQYECPAGRPRFPRDYPHPCPHCGEAYSYIQRLFPVIGGG